ncbi:MAG: tetratricopeptide repeat protein [Nitrospirae bacterium]|nr:tetratricopeptide repeat protein [Nitrospirota bacterium]
METLEGTAARAGMSGGSPVMNRTGGGIDEARRLFHAGSYADAEALCNGIVEREPVAEALHMLGVIRHLRGDNSGAAELIGRALREDAENPVYLNSLAISLAGSGRLSEAMAACRAAIKADPEFIPARINLGVWHHEAGMLDEAVSCFLAAIVKRPEVVSLHTNLGNALKDAGLIDEAIDSFRKAIDLKPGFGPAWDNYLYTLNFHPGLSAEKIAEKHRKWGTMMHCLPKAECAELFKTRDRTPLRRLRVGYISPDFRSHPVASFIGPVMANHDAGEVECYCYSDVARPDDVTAGIRLAAGRWRRTSGLSSAETAHLIREDEIDILVDLAGHSSGNRLPVFAKRAAPVQITWLGYPNTTGLDSMDWMITDAVLNPPGTDALFTERLIRLDDGFACFRPWQQAAPGKFAPDTGPSPSSKNGFVTFGSLNDLTKINDRVIALWSRVLLAVPGSRMLIFRNTLRGSVLKRIEGMFAANGIPPARLDLGSELPATQHEISGYMNIYNEIDIALDTSPWSGHATTCETLWMGVPVVTLRGETRAGRLSASALTSAGLPGLIAKSEDEYVSIAAELASKENFRADLRMSLRNMLTTSPLCDAADFAQRLEDAYRMAWKEWCKEAHE